MNTYNECKTRCPCPDSCHCWPIFRLWVAEEPQDPLKMRHICGRSQFPDPYKFDPPSEARPDGITKELVIARYKEDLSWVDDVGEEFYVNIYTKSKESFDISRPHRREMLNNTGRETHTILHHIVNYYDSLADWTYFVQGDAPKHSPDIVGRLGIDYSDPTSLTKTYTDYHPSPEIHERDHVEHVGGFEVRYGKYDLSQHVWSYVFECPMPSVIYFGYASMWAVPRSSIIGRPLVFWRWLLDEMTRPPKPGEPPIVNPWNMEILWGYLWSDPIRYPHKTINEADMINVANRQNHPIPAVIVGPGGSIHKVPPDADPSQYPGVIAQAGNFIGAMGRVAQAALHGQQITVPAEILESRRAICLPCEFNGERARGQIRCMKCGCGGIKLMLATEKCPIDKWMTWTPPEKEDPPSQMT